MRTELAKAQQERAALRPEEIRLIDPCMGSGHILVYAFDVLMQLYTQMGYTDKDAVISILENNLYGLDIDERAFQLAYFAVLMKARQYHRFILKSSQGATFTPFAKAMASTWTSWLILARSWTIWQGLWRKTWCRSLLRRCMMPRNMAALSACLRWTGSCCSSLQQHTAPRTSRTCLMFMA